jgi:lipase ATG15
VLLKLEAKIRSLAAGVGSSSRVIITGHSLGGGVASILGTRLEIPTVVFDSPGLLISRNKFDLTEWSYLKFVTVINTQGASFGSVDQHGPTLQTISCPFDILRCSRPDTGFCLLRSICGSSRNRTLLVCDRDIAAPPSPSASRG